MANIQPLEWLGDKLRILDQTRLPRKEVYIETNDYLDVVDAIKTLTVRGAPAIGVAAAYGVALGVLSLKAHLKSDFMDQLNEVTKTLAGSRPTARNLFWALERMEKTALAGAGVKQIKEALVAEAVKIHEEQRDSDEKLSRFGAGLIRENWTVLTHCNAGALATAGYGTAVGVIKRAFEDGKNIKVINTETRPLCQGARLTAYELKQAGIPFTLITDSMAGYFMKLGKINCVVTGADRIAANGDTANKIGTYTLAVLAKENGIPFYIAAPISTIDTSIAAGEQIIIEERKADEVTCIQGVCIAPEDISAANPAFDVTPHRYITAIITEKGIIKEPYTGGIKKL